MILLLCIFLAHKWLTFQSTPYLADYNVNLKPPRPLDPAPTTLKYVFAIARAGTRTPKFDPYPNHPAYKDFIGYWGESKGELTEFGEKLMTALGTSLASRYKEFIKTLTQPRIVTTADAEKRTVKSAQLVAEQLFGNTEISSTDTQHMDKYRLYSESNAIECNQFDKDRKETMDFLKREENVEESTALQRFTGNTKSLSHLDIMKIFDTVEMQRSNYKKIPQELMIFHENYLDNIDLWDFVSGREPPLYKKYTSGPLFHQILKEFDACGDNCRGFHFHVTHSLTLQAAMLTLLTSIRPLVGTTLILELHEGNKVTILLYQPLSWESPGLLEATDDNWVGMGISDLCGHLRVSVELGRYYCNLDIFRKTVPNLSPERWEDMCHGGDSNEFIYK